MESLIIDCVQLKDQGRGELLVSVCHQPAAARLTVVVLKARNLPKMDITGMSGTAFSTIIFYSLILIFINVCSDPYVKIYLLHKDQRISKKKTHVKKRTLNPVFNESFVFDLPRTDNGLADIQLEFALLDWDRVTKNEVLKKINRIETFEEKHSLKYSFVLKFNKTLPQEDFRKLFYYVTFM